MKKPISISSIASISPLGISLDDAWKAYQNKGHLFIRQEFNDSEEWIAPLKTEAKLKIEALRNSESNYKQLDDSVLSAMFAARNAIEKSGWLATDDFGVNIGSSRGATALFEKYHSEFLSHKKTSTVSSPTTTLGNISSWVAHDLQTKGPEISHSITCSTALHALVNGVAWLKSGMATKFLVGGSEAPLTPFTLAQMKAMRIYSQEKEGYPCKAMDLGKKRNTMVLGEAASVACLELGTNANTLAVVEGVGYATELLKHNVSISTDAICFQRSMKMALGTINPDEVDVIVMHAPGTIKGDLSEKAAIEKVFCNKLPLLTTNKWKVGHTFGASGMLSIELAILMLQYNTFIGTPFDEPSSSPDKVKRIVVNAVGFGGNAVSILLSI